MKNVGTHALQWGPVIIYHTMSPNSTWLVMSRLDTTRDVRRVERVETSVSNMADDGQAIVLACTSLVVFYAL